MNRRAFHVSLKLLGARLGLPPDTCPVEIQIQHLTGDAIVVVHDPTADAIVVVHDPTAPALLEGEEPRREPLDALLHFGAAAYRRPDASATVPPVVVYIAGPYRHASAWAREQNIRRAENLALAVWRLGAVALCPHSNTRYFQDAMPDDIWLAGDLELLRRSDGMLLTSDWEQSAGARAEKAFAEQLEMPIFTDIDVLERWLAVKREGLWPREARS